MGVRDAPINFALICWLLLLLTGGRQTEETIMEYRERHVE